MSPTALALRGLRVRYPPSFEVDVPALDVRRGEVLAVIGRNGSGKSTLLRVLGLLQAPQAGEVWFQGRPTTVGGGLAARRRMAIVFQQPLLADGTVAANVALGLRFRGVSAQARDARVARWLERFGITALAGRHARALSGGEAQRTALARALVLEPDVLLLDEPFGGLDQPTRAALLPDLGEILRAERTTTVLVTHDRGEALALADRVAVMIEGRLAQVDEVGRVFQAPASEEVARLVGVETVVGGVVVAVEAGVVVVDVDGRRLEVTGEARPGECVRVGIRPEDVTLAHKPDGQSPSSARNRLAGTVVRVTPGSPTRVVVDCGFPLTAVVTARSVAEMGLAAGTAVTAAFKATAAHLILGGTS